MHELHSFAAATVILQEDVGVVIPVYFPESGDDDLARHLLRDNAKAYVHQLGRPEHICLSVDGQNSGGAAAAELAAELGVQVVSVPHNRGKLNALRVGMAHLLESREFRYLAAVDMDGDHFAHELPNLVRAAVFAQVSVGMSEVLVLGSRTSKHRPMGLLRGELEELADRVLLDALQYHAAISGIPLRLECATAVEEYPDFHSGFKLFSRQTAGAVFLSEPDLLGVTESAFYRHGVEAVMTTEALLAGASLVLVKRSTVNEQPISAFGLLDRTRLVADKMVWACRRLRVPPHFVDQWLRNHIPRLLLNTLVPQGKEELLEIRRLVMAELGQEVDDDICWGPLFV
jgi:hypothetical protein